MSGEGRPAPADLETDAPRWDFYAAVRAAMAERPGAPGVGRAGRIEDEPIRFRQRPTQRFEPSPLPAATRVVRGERAVWEFEQVFFGPFGPHGALPAHVTDDALREARAGRPWLVGFLDLFTHRLTAFFFRAWQSAQLVASRDLGPDDPWPRFVDSLYGMSAPEFRDRDAVPADLRRHVAGWLAGRRRSVAALEGALGALTGAPVRVEEFAPEWLPAPPEQQARLGAARLGEAFVGPRAFSLTTRFRVRVGPLGYGAFAALLPDGPAHAAARDLVRELMGLCWAWDLQLALAAAEIPDCRLDGARRLGWDSWIGTKAPRTADPDDVTLSGTWRQ